jgi:hypothetical protein
MMVLGTKELNMTQSRQTQQERVKILELSLEEMEKVSGGQTFNEFLQGEIILLKCIASPGGCRIYTGPLR